MSLSARVAAPATIPVNIITGALGAGKTTAIANLLANKPAQDAWLVILNEFTDTGIDALTLAAAARGAYDVRMIPGGCLCCTGEADFRQQLSGVLERPSTHWPARILIEPSGIGYPGAVIEELRLFERGGAMRLESTIALLDAQGPSDWSQLDEVTRAQVDAADVLLLSKAELATAARRESFIKWAQQLFPRKRMVACSTQGVLPSAALTPPEALFGFESPVRPSLHQQARRASGHRSVHSHAPQVLRRELQLAGVTAQARTYQLLGREACGWIIPPSVLIDLPQLQALLDEMGIWQAVERCKAVLRTGVQRWHLLQRWQQQHAVVECNWSQDSRIEVQLAAGTHTDWLLWDERWQALSAVCPVG